jgi:NTE family protein
MFINNDSSRVGNNATEIDSTQKRGIFSELLSKIHQWVSALFSVFSSQENKTIESKSLQNRLKDKPVENKKDRVNNPQIDLDSKNCIIYNRKTHQYTYISKAPPIKNIVISGGGAKGVVLPGAIKAFDDYKVTEDCSFRDQLENIAGSSIGALTAALVAAGMPADRLIQVTQFTNFKVLLGNGIGPIHKDGKLLLDFIRTYMKESIRDHLKGIFNTQDLNSIDVKQKVLNHLKNSDREYNEVQVMPLVNAIERILIELQKDDLDKVCITFSMLQSLHELAPKIFKDLTVTAVCCEKGETFYLDAEKTPHLDIAIACRASASLPVVLAPVLIDRQFLSPGYDSILPQKTVLTFVDGGYLDNLPVSAMQDKQNDIASQGEYGQNLQTLVLVFDETGRTMDMQSPFFDVQTKKHALYDSSNLKDRLIRDIFAKLFSGIKTKERCTVNKEKSLEKIRQQYTQRNIPLLVSVDTLDFDKAKKHENEYTKSGYEQSMEYLRIHKDELIARNFDNLDDLLKYVPEEIKRKKYEQILNFYTMTKKGLD